MAFASARTLLARAAPTLYPPPDLRVSEWSDLHSYLSSEDSALPGKWNTANAEFQRGIMDAYNEDGIERIVVESSTQIGKTSILRNILGYIIDNDPRPCMMVQPTVAMAESFSTDRFEPFIRDTPRMHGKFKSNKTKDSGNKILHKKFPGGSIVFTGSESPSSLASRPMSVLLLDEIDRWPKTVGVEGDPLELVIRRTSNFWNRKIFIFSTPTTQYSKIHSEYLKSDQRKYFLSCPHCKKEFLFLFPSLKWTVDDQDRIIDIHFECPECGVHIEERQKNDLILKGQWIATAKGNGKTAGFWINALYSPWISWEEIIETFLNAKKDKELLKVFVNTFLAEVFEDTGDAPDYLHIYARREFYRRSAIPSADILFLTAAVDVQDKRFEVEIKGWTRNHESYSIDHLIFECDTADLESYHYLNDVLNKQFAHPFGRSIAVAGLAIDTGGHSTHATYMWVRSQNPQRVFAIKGATLDSVLGLPRSVDIDFRGHKIANGVRYWPVGVSQLKAELYSRLRLNKKEDGTFPFGYYHFPDYPEDFFKQLTAESMVLSIVRGVYRYDWRKHYERNEALDLSVYNRAVVLILGMERLTEVQWDQLTNRMRGSVSMSPQSNNRSASRQRGSRGISID